MRTWLEEVAHCRTLPEVAEATTLGTLRDINPVSAYEIGYVAGPI